MIIGLTIVTFILGCILMCFIEDNISVGVIGIILIILSIGILIFGCFHGFINYPKTEGSHVGIVTAVDLEGIYFRRYEVYLKSSGYTNQSDETVYKIYDYENELAQQLKEYLGKKVKLTYGHDGGYIGWKSCGTYHIKSVELVEE